MHYINTHFTYLLLVTNFGAENHFIICITSYPGIPACLAGMFTCVRRQVCDASDAP